MQKGIHVHRESTQNKKKNHFFTITNEKFVIPYQIFLTS